MSVAVTARTKDALDETVEMIKADNGNAIAFPADVTDQPAVNQLVADTHRPVSYTHLPLPTRDLV